MDRLKMRTANKADENYRKLAELFPNAVTETVSESGEVVRAIDADVLRQEISASVVEGARERYQFTWPDKRKSVVLANQPIAKTLRLDREKSVGRGGDDKLQGRSPVLDKFQGRPDDGVRYPLQPHTVRHNPH